MPNVRSQKVDGRTMAVVESREGECLLHSRTSQLYWLYARQEQRGNVEREKKKEEEFSPGFRFPFLLSIKICTCILFSALLLIRPGHSIN